MVEDVKNGIGTPGAAERKSKLGSGLAGTGLASTVLPAPMTLPALQLYVERVVEKRGFTRDPNRIFILLREELGELATEFKNRVYYPDRFDQRNLGFELADVLLYLLDLANRFSLQLMTIWPEHEAFNDRRFAAGGGGRENRAQIQPDFSLNRLLAHVEAKRVERGFVDTPERLLILLTEEVGEIATELRKHWGGKGDSVRLGREIIDAVTYLCRLAGHFHIDLEGAVAAKEHLNATRSWEF